MVLDPMIKLLFKITRVAKQLKTNCFAKFVLLLFAIIFISDNEAFAQNDRQITEAPECLNNLSERVLFVDRKSVGQKFAAGMARRDENGKPTVYRFNYESASLELQQFIDFHECAHHQVGDIDRPHPPRNSAEHLMNESIADCIAILRFRDDPRRSDENYTNLINALMSDMQGVGFPKVSISSRISNISNCYENYTTARSFIDGVLEYRGLK